MSASNLLDIEIKQYFPKNRSLLSTFSKTFKEKSLQDGIGVYKIPCRDCTRVYIGETSRTLKSRIVEHRGYYIMNQIGKSAAADHFSLNNHTPNFESAHMILHVNNTRNRKIAEAILINKHSVVDSNSASFALKIFN